MQSFEFDYFHLLHCIILFLFHIQMLCCSAEMLTNTDSHPAWTPHSQPRAGTGQGGGLCVKAERLWPGCGGLVLCSLFITLGGWASRPSLLCAAWACRIHLYSVFLLVCSFSLLSTIPSTVCVCQLLGIWAAPRFGLLWIELLWTCVCMCLCDVFFLGYNLGMRLLGPMVSLRLTLSKRPNCFQSGRLFVFSLIPFVLFSF